MKAKPDTSSESTHPPPTHQAHYASEKDEKLCNWLTTGRYVTNAELRRIRKRKGKTCTSN